MPYDVALAERLRDLLMGEPGLTEKRMFGGLAFLLDGTMAVAASSQGGLLLRVGRAQTDDLVDEPHVGRFVMRGKPMDGWLRVDADAVDTTARLKKWVRIGVDAARV